MRVIPLTLGNQYDHINYLLACPETGEALSVDPFGIDRILAEVAARGLTLKTIVSTHEHWDHAGRNAALKERTGAEIAVPRAAAGTIEGADRLLAPGDQITVGRAAPLRVLATPGHTMTHIGLLGAEDGRPFLICGDTLFGAGVGNCGYGGHAPTLYDTISQTIAPLADDVRLYPGHDYLRRNLDFTLAVEPDNEAARALAATLDAAPDRERPRFTSIGEERAINAFFRLSSPSLRAKLRDLAPDLPPDPTDQDVFLALRQLRDRW